MTDAERQYLQDYVNTLIAALGLAGWTVYVTKEPCARNAAASVHNTGHSFEAWMRVADEANDQGALLSRNPEEIRAVVTHELLHLPSLQADDMVCTDLAESGFLPKPAMALFEATYRRLREHATQQVAQGVARYLPMPPSAPETPSRASRKRSITEPRQ